MASARSYSLSELVERTGFDRRTIVYYIQSGLLPKVGRRGPNTRYPEECHARLQFIRGVKTHQAEGRLLTATLAEIGRALEALDAEGLEQILARDLPPAEVAALFSAPAKAASPASLPPPAPPPGAATPAIAAPPGDTAPPPPPTVRSEAASPPADPGPAPSGPAGDRRFYGLADAGIRQRFGAERAVTPPAPQAGGVGNEGSADPAQAPLPGNTVPAPPAAGSGPSAVDPNDLGALLRELELRPTLNTRRAAPGAPEQWTEIPITSRVYLSVRGLSEEDAPLAESCARLLKRALRGR